MLARRGRSGLFETTWGASCNTLNTRGKSLSANINRTSVLQARWLCTSHKHSVILFPGQGSQFVGMCSGLPSNLRVQELFRKAQDVLGYDILTLCNSGPADKLNQTEFCQPAVFLSSLAALECLADTKPEFSSRDDTGPNPNLSAAAGFSVGEFAALVFGRAMAFEEALEVVQLRAQAMQKASEEFPSGMVSVTGLTEDQTRQLCDTAKNQAKPSCAANPPVAVIASHLFPKGYVIAGSENVIQVIDRLAVTEHGAKTVHRLPVSGAFHSHIMSAAQPALKAALDRVKIRMPQIPVYSNVTAQPYNSTVEIKRLLVQQLVEPVRWNQTVLNILHGKGAVSTYEVGPGRQLKSMMFYINKKVLKNFTNVEAR